MAIVGFFSLSNYLQESIIDIENKKENMQIESQKIIEHCTYNELTLDECNEKLENYAESVAKDSKEDYYFVFGNKSDYTLGGYTPHEGREVTYEFEGIDNEIQYRQPRGRGSFMGVGEILQLFFDILRGEYDPDDYDFSFPGDEDDGGHSPPSPGQHRDTDGDSKKSVNVSVGDIKREVELGESTDFYFIITQENVGNINSVDNIKDEEE